MIVYRMRSAILLVAAIATITALAVTGGASAAVPVKLTFTGQFEAGFQFAEGVAAAPSGNVYAIDSGNKRIQELSASGQFLLMFGKEVNKKTSKGGVCTAAEISECQAGVEGSAPGQFDAPYSIAVDPVSGDVYVAEYVFGEGYGQRVQKFTPEGHFVLEIGKDVNKNTGGNLCTHVEEVEGVKCTGPALHEIGAFAPEDGSFNFEEGRGNLLAVGAGGKLYVGDEGRVQEFTESGQFSGEIALEPGTRVDALALDGSGNLYLTTGSSRNIVQRFDVNGGKLRPFPVTPEVPNAEVGILGLAVDGEGHLAVTALQNGTPFGSLYEASSGMRLTAFRLPESEGAKGIAFNGSGQLYVATEGADKILQYTPKTVALLVLTTFEIPCPPGTKRETDLTVNCTLKGEVDPEGVLETEAWFGWGRGSAVECGLASMTTRQALPTSGKVEPVLEGLRPNETYCYQLVAEDANAKSPEPLTTELASFKTKLAPPQILTEPQAQFVKASSAVMFDQLNPENAQTTYFFEYAPGQKALAKCLRPIEECFIGPRVSCSGGTRTPLGKSAVYGLIGATSEAVGLQPGTEYSYRLLAENENFAENENVAKEKKERCVTRSGEGSFMTATVPSPSAETGGHSAPGATSAVVYATVIPNGAPVTCSFELGVYGGAATQYGVVSSGSVEANSGPVGESLALTGLQPGTTYAYRIAISSGYIDNPAHTLQGQPATFTTTGLPAVLQPPLVLAQLPVPQIVFPKATVSKPKAKAKGKAKKKKKKKRSKAKKGKKARRSSAPRLR